MNRLIKYNQSKIHYYEEEIIKIDYYVIHLKRDKYRVENIKNMKNILKKDIQIFEAIDSEYIILDNNNIYYKGEKINVNIGPHINQLFPGEIGCYLSHLLLYNYINNKTNDGYSIIFEDDAKFNENLHDNIITFIKQIDFDFDLLYLGNLNLNYGNRYKNNIYFIDKNNKLDGSHCYLINNKNISKIYNNCLYMDDAIDTTIKLFMNDNTFSGLVIYPPLVIQNYYCKTTITRNFKINKNKLLTLIIKKNVS
jgi:GR25 family glycosyltransferase involved in LPS biosynthesis